MKEDRTKLLERILVFATITSFILALLVILQSIIAANSKAEENYIDFFCMALTFFSGIFYVIVLQIFVNEKTKSRVHIVFLFFYLVFELFLSFIFGFYNAPYVLIPTTIVHYFLEASLNEIFVFHDFFLYKNDQRKGKELVEYLFHNNFAASEFASKRKAFQGYLFAIGFLMTGMVAAAFIFGNGVTLLLVILIVIFYFCLFVSFWLLGFFNSESYYAFLGFNDISQNNAKIFKTGLLIFSLSLLFAFCFSSNKCLIDISKFAQKIESQTYTPPANEEPPHIENYDLDFGDGGDFGELKEAKEPSPVFEIIFKILKIALISAAIIFILFYLISPFFSDNWKKYWQERKFVKFLHKIFKDLKELFALLFFSKNADDDNYAKVQSKTFKQAINDFLRRSKKSKEKKNEIDRLTRHFMLLIDWGSRREIKYTKNLAPAEYTEKIKKYLQENPLKESELSPCETCDLIGKLFEKALYDKELLTKDLENSFFRAINDIIKNKGR